MTFSAWLRMWRSQFPMLTAANARRTSDDDEGYNCFAWAAEDTGRRWAPDEMRQFYWPPQAPRELTVDAFIQTFHLQGYAERSDPSLDPRKHKVAIYTSPNGTPQHMSRQRPDGWWASKIGDLIDIEHEFHALDGPLYGRATVVLARPAR